MKKILSAVIIMLAIAGTSTAVRPPFFSFGYRYNYDGGVLSRNYTHCDVNPMITFFSFVEKSTESSINFNQLARSNFHLDDSNARYFTHNFKSLIDEMKQNKMLDNSHPLANYAEESIPKDFLLTNKQMLIQASSNLIVEKNLNEMMKEISSMFERQDEQSLPNHLRDAFKYYLSDDIIEEALNKSKCFMLNHDFWGLREELRNLLQVFMLDH